MEADRVTLKKVSIWTKTYGDGDYEWVVKDADGNDVSDMTLYVIDGEGE